MTGEWEHFAFSREFTRRVLEHLQALQTERAFYDAQLAADIKELEGALNEPKC